MPSGEESWVYGPVPSRRLGRSLGINTIPAKVCTYACIYCQAGRTTRLETDRSGFYDPEAIRRDVQKRLASLPDGAASADILTFVPDGEPTLDANLGRTIDRLKPLGVPVGVISNSSLLDRADVREDLAEADWVSLKVDAVREPIWRKVNRPCRELRLPAILDGVQAFAEAFAGKRVTETMLVSGINDGEDHLEALSDVIARLKPVTAYLSIPTRPPAEAWARPPDENRLNRAYQILARKVDRVEYLIGYEGDAFAYSGDAANDILSITAVHPMRESAVRELLSWAGAGWDLVDRLMEEGDLTSAVYQGHPYYVRKFKHEPARVEYGSTASA
jgi:wyosine [tRNA(Phe)-imidazoG37] synthetase (radical SAM superfamily)